MIWHRPTQSFSSSDNFFKILWNNALKDENSKFNLSPISKSKLYPISRLIEIPFLSKFLEPEKS